VEVLLIASLTAWMTFTVSDAPHFSNPQCGCDWVGMVVGEQVPMTWNVCSEMPQDLSDYTSDEKVRA
jgi:hypothetical protein